MSDISETKDELIRKGDVYDIIELLNSGDTELSKGAFTLGLCTMVGALPGNVAISPKCIPVKFIQTYIDVLKKEADSEGDMLQVGWLLLLVSHLEDIVKGWIKYAEDQVENTAR